MKLRHRWGIFRRGMFYWRVFGGLGVVLILALAGLTLATWAVLKPLPTAFATLLTEQPSLQVLDRYGEPLNITYQNAWNVHASLALHQIPEFLKTSFVISEDQRFYQHTGPDWRARSAALVTNVRALRAVRGASTITEQVVRMIHPRPRTVWSRWLEGFEAYALERQINKAEILEFYLNQVPYAAARRGVHQAARYYFNRSLDTLSKKEMLALVVLVRSPSRLDLWRNPQGVEAGIQRLADQLIAHGVFSEDEKTQLIEQNFELQQAPQLAVDASEFIRFVKQQPRLAQAHGVQVNSTLDAGLQRRVQNILDQRLDDLVGQHVHNGAVLAVDHKSAEILAWVVAGKAGADTPGRFIDAVTAPRQPGSALKPFLYSLALSKGWTAATVIEDSPLTESVGNGLHSYQNYSRSFYGSVTLRQALGNSLNIPALKALQFVGVEHYLHGLHQLGFSGLNQHPNFYGDGLALGNGEVTLYELVQAYTALANQGRFRSLTVFNDGAEQRAPEQQVVAPELASLLGNILSDSSARLLEFGQYSVLNLPVQTAVKTGTSSDYRDSWALGYNYRFTVGVWMGNLDQRPTDGITGSTGPALVLRSVFAELNKFQATQALPIHKKLLRQDLCIENQQLKQGGDSCESYTEWFAPGTTPQLPRSLVAEATPIRLRRPAYGLHLAYDPRVPATEQAFEFFVQGLADDDQVVWDINGTQVITRGGKYVWPLQKGAHVVQARVTRTDQLIAEIEPTSFFVK